ncbi:MAG: sigma 54-interacting transcriptional regulator [Myxococcota bacterium]
MGELELDQSTVRPGGAARLREQLRAPCLTVVFHPDLSRVGEVAWLSAAQPLALSRASPSFVAPSGGPARPLSSALVSRSPLTLRVTPRGIELEPGSADVTLGGAPLTAPALITGEQVDAGQVLVLGGRVALLLHSAGPRPPEPPPSFGLIGESDVVLALRRRVEQVAKVDVPVLLRGETGSGKDLVARAIAGNGARATGPFVTVNLAAVPSSTAVAELFGHAAGAFTGATARRAGAFARADGGVLFLDEIGDVPLDVQALLLRTLDSGEVQPLGSPSFRVDVRVIAATDADLERKVKEGTFREALLHRLRALTVVVPPLRARREDIGRLFAHALRAELAIAGRLDLLERLSEPSAWLDGATVAALVMEAWPGNVRQLRNVARQAAVIGIDQGVVTPAALELTEQSLEAEPRPGRRVLGDEEVVAALRAHGFRPGETARALGISRTTLYALIERSTVLRKAKDVTEQELAEAHSACSGDVEAMAARLEVSERGLRLRLKELERAGR